MRNATKLKKPRLNLAVRGIDGHVVMTTSGDWAWFMLPVRRWAFLPRNQRTGLVDAFTRRLCEFTGYDLHLRITSRPYQTMDWVRRLDGATPHPLGGKYEDSPWAKHVVVMAQRIDDLSISEKVVYFGVKLRSRRSAMKVIDVAARVGLPVPDGALMTRERELEDLAKIVASEGMYGRPATTQEIEWLFRRSLSMGMSSPKVTPTSVPWTKDDLVDIADATDAKAAPMGGAVHLARCDGEQSYVVGLALGRAEETDRAHDRWPWLTLGERYGAEVSVRLRVVDPKQAAKRVEHRIMVVRAQEEHYAEMGTQPPKALPRTGKRASQIEDEITNGEDIDATRFDGYVYLAVTAPVRKDTPQGHNAARAEALERARRLREAYARTRKTVVRPHGPASGVNQWSLVRSFVPGEPIPSTAHRQRGPVLYVGAGFPMASSTLGDKEGFYFGTGVGAGSQPVFINPFRAPEIERSGVFSATGEQGAGKSTIGVLYLYNGVMRGDPWTAWDPPGTLAGLCDLPEFSGVSQKIDLRSGVPGLLNPYSLIPEPRREDFATREKWWAAQRRAQQQRRSLACDILVGLLPAGLYRSQEARLAIQDAVTQAPATALCHLGLPLDILNEADEGAHKRVVRFLRQQAEAENGDLLFASLGHEWAEVVNMKALLMIVSATGIVVPGAEKKREDWSPSEQTAGPLLLAATYLTAARVRDLPRTMRKGLIIDEAKLLGRTPMGAELLVDLTSQARKLALSLGVFDQSPNAILGIGGGDEIGHQFGTSYVGRTTSRPTAAANLPLLGLHPDSGYEELIMSLSPPGPTGKPKVHEFVMRDADGQVGIVETDLGHIPQALAVTDTTPGADKESQPKRERIEVAA